MAGVVKFFNIGVKKLRRCILKKNSCTDVILAQQSVAPMALLYDNSRNRETPDETKKRLSKTLVDPQISAMHDACRQGITASVESFLQRNVDWAANRRFEIPKFEFKFPRARTYELYRARSRLYRSKQASKQASKVVQSKPNFASKYSLELGSI